MRSDFRVEKKTRRAGGLSVVEKCVAEQQGTGVSGSVAVSACCVAWCCVPLLPALCSSPLSSRQWAHLSFKPSLDCYCYNLCHSDRQLVCFFSSSFFFKPLLVFLNDKS